MRYIPLKTAMLLNRVPEVKVSHIPSRACNRLHALEQISSKLGKTCSLGGRCGVLV